MKVTLVDIAKELGISHATVSLALNHSPKVADGTRQKVLAKAEEMGYRSNPYVSALMSARRKGREPAQSPTIALITAGENEQSWKQHHHVSRFVEGCTVTAESLGIQVELFWLGAKNMTAKRLNDIIINRGIRGAVFLTHGDLENEMDYQWRDIARVTYGIRSFDVAMDWVTADLYGNMEIVMNVLKAQSLRRIGFVMDRPFPYKGHNRWLAAYLMEQSNDEGESMEPWIDPEPTFEKFKKWFNSENPETIICVYAPSVIIWLNQLGLKVPEDIGVVSVGTAVLGEGVTGIVENTQRCGKIAIEMLLDRIHRGEFGIYHDPYHIKMSGLWNRGETLGYLND